MRQRFDVVVVGAGIVGAACAERLAARGRSVAVVDASAPATGTTAAGMGHLVVMDGDEAQLALTALSRRLWSEHASAMPEAVEYERCGTLWVAEDDEELAEAHTKCARYREHGVDAEVIDAAALARAEPQLRPGLRGALRVPDDAVLYQPNATTWLLDRAVAHGAIVLPHRRVAEVAQGQVMLADGATLRGEHVVVAAGSASLELLSTRAFDGAIVRRKGHLAITAASPGLCRHQLVELGYIKRAHGNARESVAFNLQPRKTGQVLVGSSRQYGSDDRRVEPGIVQRMLRRALRYMPALATIPILRTWTGFRPATADGLPLLGPLPDDPRTLLAAGHEGLGITAAPGTASIIESFVCGRPFALDPAPFAVTRVVEGPAHG